VTQGQPVINHLDSKNQTVDNETLIRVKRKSRIKNRNKLIPYRVLETSLRVLETSLRVLETSLQVLETLLRGKK